MQALSKLAERVDGRYRIVSQPPVVIPLRDLAPRIGLSVDELEHVIHDQFRDYRKTLQDDRRHLLEQFDVVDMAHKVVGVGSVGTRAFIVLLQGRDQDDPLFLQVKEATASVLEDHLPKSQYRHAGERVVQGQRLMQAASDIFLGWTKGHQANRYLYWRQLRDMKGSALVENMVPAAIDLLRASLRSNPRARPRPFRRPGGAGRVHGQEGSVRPIHHRLLRTLRRPERARLSGLRRRDPFRPARRARERLIAESGSAVSGAVFDTRWRVVIVLGAATVQRRGVPMMLADGWHVGQVFWSLLWFTLFFIWIWLLIVVFADIFRSHDLGGFAKFLWVLFVIVVPYLGVFVYLIARGNKMSEHAEEAARAQDAAARAYIQDAAGTSTSAADELSRLADLKARGVIDEAEFQRLKAKVVAPTAPSSVRPTTDAASN